MRTRTREKIVELARRQGPVRPVELAGALGIGRAALHRQLRKLEASGEIIKEGKAPLVTYRVYDSQGEARRIADMIRPVLKEYGVTKAELFGSVARGDMTKTSDVDVLVELPRGSSLLRLGGLYIDLKDKLKRDVDIVSYRAIHPYIEESVLSARYRVI